MLYMRQNRNSSPFHLIGHLYLFLDYLTRSSSSTHIQQGSRLRDLYIHAALHFIEHNFQNDISVEDIASVCGLNRSYSRAFKNIYGDTPRAWRNHNRISI